MNPSPFAVSPNTHVSQVFNLFRTMGLRHLPVVNAVGEVSPYLHFVLAEQGSQCGFLQCLNIKQKCFKEIRMGSSEVPEALLITVTVIFCVEACFLLSLQRAGHAVSPLSQVCSMWKPLLSCTSWDALSSSEAANLASSLTALCKAKSRISCVLGQEVFLLEGNLHSVPTHRSSKIKESLNDLCLIHLYFSLCHLQCSGIVSRCQ